MFSLLSLGTIHFWNYNLWFFFFIRISKPLHSGLGVHLCVHESFITSVRPSLCHTTVNECQPFHCLLWWTTWLYLHSLPGSFSATSLYTITYLGNYCITHVSFSSSKHLIFIFLLYTRYYRSISTGDRSWEVRVRYYWAVPLIKTWCDQIKFLQRIVIGLYLGLYKEKNISLPGGKIVGPPYWQIKRINPFFILNPFPYHKIMKIQIPPSSQILNCTHNITPGLKRKRGRKKKNVPCLQPSQIVAQVLFVLNFFQ